ncbi:hypothetical protein [Curvivirga sp.]|uniref:hypothetical protein n=1 Tax=Curvivirga sp. TaxID=2856848 RepID=UPI003B5C9F91
MLKRFIIAIMLIPTTLVGIYFIAQFTQPDPENINDPKIAMRIGEKYASRHYPLYDGLKAQPYFERARELGEKAASAYLAHIYYITLPPEEACSKALTLGEEAQGTSQAGRGSYFLGLAYYEDKCGFNDIDKAMGYFLQSTEQGSTFAYWALATIYENEKVDLPKAKHWNELMQKEADKISSEIEISYKITNFTKEVLNWYMELLDS